MGGDNRQRVVILGGGFGGLYAALELDKTLAKDRSVTVTLISRENFFLFTPMLHEVAASDLDITHIVSPIRQMLRHVDFCEGTVESIDLEAKKVVVTYGLSNQKQVVEYDYLLIALGGITNFYHLPGLEEHALTMKSLGDAIYLRNRLIANLETAHFEKEREGREPYLTLVVAGGGFAGVETVAGVNDFLREAIRFYPRLNEEELRVVLVNDQPVILTEVSEKLGRYACEKLSERKVEVRLGHAVKGFSEKGVELADGTLIRTNTLVWTAGVAANPLVQTLPCKKERGRLVANEYMEVAGYPGVWALGDCATIPDIKTGKPYPPTAQHAMRQGTVCARNIRAAIRGERGKPFVYSSMGQMAALGKRAGVANILGINISGFVAWVLWRTIYLVKLPRFEKKLRVALDWALDLFFTADIVQFMTVRAHTVSQPED